MEILHYPEKLRLYNDVLIRAEKQSEDIIDTGKLKIYKDTTFNKHQSKRIFGEVIAVPYRLRPVRVHQEDHEFPKGTMSFSGENIRLQVIAYQNVIKRELQVKETQVYRDRFASGPYEPEFTRNHHQEIVAEKGDTAWFHYLALSDEAYLGQDEQHRHYYRVPYDTCFCFSNDNEVKMANGYVQVVPFFDDTFENIEVDGKIIRGKLKGNLVVSLKQAPEYLTGTVVRKGVCFGKDDRTTIKDGDVVLYANKGAEFHNTIQGKEVMLMRQWQIIAKRVGNTFVPVGDYVHLRTKKIPPRKIVLVDHFYNEEHGQIEDVVSMKKTLDYLVEPVGEVISLGEKCEHLTSKSNQVYFNTKAKVYNLEDTIFLREGDVIADFEGEWKTKTEVRIKI